jgi:hypothetical protein
VGKIDCDQSQGEPMKTPLITCDGQSLPFAYQWLVEQRLTELGPWYFIEEQTDSDAFREEFRREVAPPNSSSVTDFQPFARSAGCDDFAGFVIRGGQVTKEVLYVHLTFSKRPEAPGYPGMTLYDDVWDWLSGCVIQEMRRVVDRLEKRQ